jgi:hypothetical protein
MAITWEEAEAEQDRVIKRGRLIEEVRRGKMTPDEAETEAKELGLGPLASTPDPIIFDPTNEALWGLLMVVAWIMTRELNAVRELWPDWRKQKEFWVRRRWQVPGRPIEEGYLLESPGPAALVDLRALSMKGKCVFGSSEAIKQLLSKLRAGEIEATGIPSTTGKREIIPAYEWRDLDVFQENKKVVVRTAPGFGPGYDDVAIKREEVMKLWPAKESPSGRRNAKSNAVVGCREWLEELRRAGPQQKTRKEYATEAFERFGIGPDQFRTAWKTAAANVPNDRWSRPGRRTNA